MPSKPDHSTPTRSRRTQAGAPSPSELGARIKAARKAAGLTQVEAAKRLKISQQSYSDRKRTTKLPYGMAVEMIRVLGYDPAILCPEILSSRDGGKR